MRKYFGIAYALFLAVFVVLPLLIIMGYAFTDEQGHLTASNLIEFVTNTRTLGTVLYSVVIAFVTTAVCLAIAYPTAFVLAKGALAGRFALLLLIITPMWINFTLRITALKEVLGFLEGNMAYYPFLNTIIGEVYDFLPFMVLPLYNVMEDMDVRILEAASDLGAKPHEVFWRVMLPLSLPGVISGVIMVFLPAMTNYVVLDMLYNSTFIMGSLIGSYFSSYDWHRGSMISATLLLFVAVIASVLRERPHSRRRDRSASQPDAV